MYASNSLAIDEHTLAVIRFSRATCIFRMLCMPLTIMLPFTACADVKMISEMKTNDQMKKMEGTMTDASECASIAPAAFMYEVSFVDGVGTLATAVSDSAALPALAILGLSGNPGLDGGRAALVSAVGSGPTSVLSLGLDEVIDGRGASTLGAASGAAITSWAAAPGSRRDPRLQYRAEHGSETQPDGFAMDGAMM